MARKKRKKLTITYKYIPDPRAFKLALDFLARDFRKKFGKLVVYDRKKV